VSYFLILVLLQVCGGGDPGRWSGSGEVTYFPIPPHGGTFMVFALIKTLGVWLFPAMRVLCCTDYISGA
jgi:hypothetical protein